MVSNCCCMFCFVFFFKQKTAYEMRISDWSSDVCSSDLHLFDQCLNADRMQLFIGDESGYRVLDECSVVTAPYYVAGKVAGTLGVIGPTRMAYHRIIPIVRETARLLSAGLKGDG